MAVSWYNSEHYHSGIGFLTPEDVHYGRAEQGVKERQAVLNTAYEKTETIQGEEANTCGTAYSRLDQQTGATK